MCPVRQRKTNKLKDYLSKLNPTLPEHNKLSGLIYKLTRLNNTEVILSCLIQKIIIEQHNMERRTTQKRKILLLNKPWDKKLSHGQIN